MGIELPPELAGVAAQAGVQWPQADEDKLRASATAWRQAGTQLTAVTSDADGTAHQALGAVQGQTGDAATAHWNTFVAPDTGHLTSAAKGCTDAADRLDHAADQVGAAKVQIVSHLVGLAKTNDAASAAASAGHPAALLGIPSAVRGTAASVAGVNSDLTHSIRLDSTVAPLTHTATTAVAGVTQNGTGAAAAVAHTAAHPGADPLAGLAHTATGATHSVAELADTAAPNLTHGLTHTATDAVSGAAHAGSGAVAGVSQAATGHSGLSGGYGGLGAFAGNGGLPGQVLGTAGVDPAHLAQLPTPPAGIPVAAGQHDFPGDPSSTGPLPIGPPGGIAPAHGWGDPGAANAPTPGYGTPLPVHPGVPVPQHGGTDHLPTPGYGTPVVYPQHPGVAHAPTPPLGTTVQSSAAPVLEPPVRPAMGGAAAAAYVAEPGPAVPSAGISGAAPVFDAAPPAPVGGDFGGGGISAGVGGGGGSSSGVSGPGTAWSATPAGPPQSRAGYSRGPDVLGQVDVPGQPGAGGRAGGQRPAPLVPGAAPAAAPGSGKPQQTSLALFLIYLFPLGHLPKATSRPHRQLPAPPAEVDYAAGLRFPPHDHPDADLVRDTAALAAAQHGEPASPKVPGLGVGHPGVAPLADGYDPLGGGNEHEWDRRFLVRPPGELPAEFAWPPGELFPEGGCDTGEAELLPAGTLLDRFGGPEGRVFAAAGTPFAHRALPPERLDAGYRCYRVLRDLPVWRTLSAAWFGQPGGGVRYRATHPAADLEALGYLAATEPEVPAEPERAETETTEPQLEEAE